MTRRQWLSLAAAASLPAAPAEIGKFLDDFFESWVRADPEAATAMRIFPPAEQERLDAQLSDASDQVLHARISRAREGLAALRRFDHTRFSAAQRLSADMLEWLLRDVVDEEPFLAYRMPLNQFSGIQVRLPTFMTDVHPVRSRRDAENYLARLGAFSSRIDQAAAAMQERAQQGIRPPAFILAETVAQMKRFTAPQPAENILVTSFAARLEKAAGVPSDQRDAMTANAQRVVRDAIYPAYRRAADGLATQQTRASDDAGLSRLPHGDEAYAFYLRRYTTTTMTAGQIHRKGLDEVARIEAAMDGVLKKLGYNDGSVNDRMRKLEDDNLYPDTPEVRTRVLADYEKIVRDANDRSAEAFDHRPKAPCIVQRIPAFQEANAAANYQAPPRDGSRPGIFRVPLPGPRFSRVSMRTLAHHEAIPGHHFQLALQVEMASLPQFRRSNPFGPLSAYTEGWGLYAEGLVSELGWYRGDAVSDLGRLASELFRARRLVTDTGLHTMRWTREQAVAYGIRQSEVDRYVVMPGQACSYKIGQLRILELREQARQQLGGRFSLKQFHNMVLGNGAIPLTLLEREVENWVKEQKG
jgi:uncharacterized protein (DUF885 family)